MTDIDIDRLNRMLLRIESDAHRFGWDRPSALFALYDEVHPGPAMPAIRAVRVDGYRAMQWLPDEALGERPPRTVFRIASLLWSGPVGAALARSLRSGGFLGIAFRFEGWMLTGNEAERDRYGPNRGLADHPGAKEIRSINAVDVTGTMHHALRVRGRKPEIQQATPVGPRGAQGEHSGAIPSALMLIVEAIAGREWPSLPLVVPDGFDEAGLGDASSTDI